MNIAIVFQEGSLAGRTVPVPPGAVLSVGRSHTCDLRADEPDVSSQHLVFRRTNGDTLTVEVISARRTMFNGERVAQGDTFPLRDGDTLALGASLACRIAAADADANATVGPAGCPGDLPTIPPSAPSVPPSAEPSSGEQETVAIQTRLASDEELDAIRDEHRRRRSRRTLLVLLPLIAFAVGAVALYILLRPETEETASWPVDAAGQTLNRPVPLTRYLAFTAPDVPEWQETRTETGVEIWSRAGRHRDIPLHFEARTETSPDYLDVGRERAFDNWLRAYRAQDPTFNPSPDVRRHWSNREKGNGALFNSVSYARRHGEDDWYGYVLFTRFEDARHVIFVEVPLKDRYRAEPFLRANLPAFGYFAPRRVPELWEGTDSRREDTSVRQDLDEAEAYLRQKAPTVWEKAWYLLRSALIKAKKAGDESSLAEGRALLRKMREDQGTWYATQKLAWEYAVRKGRRGDIQSVQALGESVFSVEFRDSDSRYDTIKRKEWK